MVENDWPAVNRWGLVAAIALSAAAARVSVTPSQITMDVGTSQRFTAKVTGAGNKAVTWTTTCGTLGTLTNGLFLAKQAGSCRVNATAAGSTGSALVTITLPPEPDPEPIPGTSTPPNPDPVPEAACPFGAVTIAAGLNIMGIVNAFQPGALFCLEAGVHRLAQITPRNGDRFVGAPGAILSGARVLEGFTFDGLNYWIGGQTQEGYIHGACLPTSPRCNRPEELFLDDARLRHVGSLAGLGVGSWWFDYANDRIYLRDNPVGHRVETSLVSWAFTGSASDVLIDGVTVEKYANIAQAGALAGDASVRWTIRNSTFRLNHGVGLRIGHGMRVLGSRFLDNGQLGLGGIGDGVLVEGNLITRNNAAGFDPGWEAGGTKFVKTLNLVVRTNFVHHNLGPQLWTDIDNRGTLYENNTVEDSPTLYPGEPLRVVSFACIMHEISYSAIIRGNTLRRCGVYTGNPYTSGAGVLVAASPDVEIVGNTIDDSGICVLAMQQNRSGDGATYGPHIIANTNVHENACTVRNGRAGGAVTDTGDLAIFTSLNNRWQGNRYTLPSATAGSFLWQHADRTWPYWQGAGMDTAGAVQ